MSEWGMEADIAKEQGVQEGVEFRPGQ